MTLIIHLLVMSLAIWRVSVMFEDVAEGGPADILHWLRVKIGVRYDEMANAYGTNWVARGLLCHKCSSVWFGAIGSLALLLIPSVALYVSLVFAFSAIVVLLER